MPYQDIEEDPAAETPHVAGPFEVWLHKIFIEDWSLKLLALAITVVLWLAVTGQNKPVTIRTGVQLNFIVPENLVISSDPPRTVDLLLTGSRHKFDQLSNLVGTVDITENRPGERVVRLSEASVKIDQLPEGVKIEAFQPSSLAIRLEPRVERELEVEVRLSGEPMDGYEIYEVRVTRNRVRIRGPASHVNDILKASTETIWVDRRRETFTVPNVAIDISDQKIDLLDPVVDVTVEIGVRRVEKSFEVAVHSPAGFEVQPQTTTVTVYGPETDVAQLQVDNMRVVVDFSSNGEVTTNLELPPEIRDRLTIRSINPTNFSIAK